jgi:Mor family transcriptional regulator
MRRQQRRQYPKVLAGIAVEVTKMMMARGDEEQTAMDFGFQVAELIRGHLGGSHVYIPKGQEFYLSKRDEEIRREFNGTNRQELCRQHSISEMRFYQIISAGRTKQAASTKAADNKRNEDSLRARAWESMRALRRFTLPDLLQASGLENSTANYQNLKRWVYSLSVHAVVVSEPRGGVHALKVWNLNRDCGSLHPLVCDLCAADIHSPSCISPSSAVQEGREGGRV